MKPEGMQPKVYLVIISYEKSFQSLPRLNKGYEWVFFILCVCFF